MKECVNYYFSSSILVKFTWWTPAFCDVSFSYWYCVHLGRELCPGKTHDTIRTRILVSPVNPRRRFIRPCLITIFSHHTLLIFVVFAISYLKSVNRVLVALPWFHVPLIHMSKWTWVLSYVAWHHFKCDATPSNFYGQNLCISNGKSFRNLGSPFVRNLQNRLWRYQCSLCCVWLCWL